MPTAVAAAEQSLGDARDRVVRAAELCFAQYGVAKTTVEDVARLAGISRASVYRYFPGGRDEIILAALLASAHEFIPQIPARLRSARSVGDAIVELIVSAVDWVRGEPWRAALLATPLSRTLDAADAAAPYAVCSAFIAPYFGAAQQAGLEPERRAFSPHITLARWNRRNAEAVEAFLRRHADLRSEPFGVEEFILFESRLSRHGPHYEEVATFPLD